MGNCQSGAKYFSEALILNGLGETAMVREHREPRESHGPALYQR
jgi:hypothetical protein